MAFLNKKYQESHLTFLLSDTVQVSDIEAWVKLEREGQTGLYSVGDMRARGCRSQLIGLPDILKISGQTDPLRQDKTIQIFNQRLRIRPLTDITLRKQPGINRARHIEVT